MTMEAKNIYQLYGEQAEQMALTRTNYIRCLALLVMLKNGVKTTADYEMINDGWRFIEKQENPPSITVPAPQSPNNAENKS